MNDWTAIALEEYRSLRTEALAAIDRQQRITASGTTTAGVLLALGANARPGSTLAVVLLLVLEPLLAGLVTVMWLGEVERMVRAGAYISMLEQRVGREFAEAPLQWESRLRREGPGGRRILWVYRAVFGVLWLIALAAALIGVVGVGEHGTAMVVLAASLDGICILLLACFYLGSELRLRTLGGKRWSGRRPPWLLRWFGGGQAAAEAFTPSAEPLLDAPAARQSGPRN